MTRPAEFQASDLSAAVMVATGHLPEVFRQPGRPLVTFEFEDNDVTRAIIIAYASGNLVLPVKRFAACCAWLYRQAKGVR